MAISASSYSVGNRLYKGATSAPTRGRVDPTGYIDRELNKVADSRSGVAAAALRRMSANNPIARTQGQIGAVPDQGPRSGPTKGFGQGGNPGDQPISVTPAGKITPPVLRSNVGMPFDAEAADATEVAEAGRNRFLQESLRARQDIERQYAEQQRSLGQEQPVNQRNLLNNYAGRGLAYSSGYANDFDSLQTEYANRASELAAGRTRGYTGLDEEEASFNNEHSTRLNAIQRAAARKAAERAAEIELENQRAIREAEEAQRLEDADFERRKSEAEAKAAADKAAADAAAQAGLTYNTPLNPNPTAASNPNAPYDNRYNSPNFNPNPNSPTVGAPSIGAPAGGAPPIMNGPGRNLRPNPEYTGSTPVGAGTPTPAAPPAAAQPVDLVNRPGGVRELSSFDAASKKKLTNGGEVTGGNGYVYKYNPLTSRVERVR